MWNLHTRGIKNGCFLFFRALVKSGFETCLDTYEADPAIIEKNSVYDPDDYSPVFLQVLPHSVEI